MTVAESAGLSDSLSEAAWALALALRHSVCFPGLRWMHWPGGATLRQHLQPVGMYESSLERQGLEILYNQHTSMVKAS